MIIGNCEVCGRPVERYVIYQDNKEKFHFMCDECGTSISKCRLCIHGQTCLLQEDDTMPTFVMNTVRQDNMVIQTQVVNPEKIRKHCENGCECFSSEFGCLKQFNSCNKQITIFDNIDPQATSCSQGSSQESSEQESTNQ